MPFTDALFYITFRKYQEDMLTVFEEQRKSGETKFHFVAPPGSGKTIIGLEIVRRIGEKAVVFSPNQAIQAQWLTRLKELTDDISGSADPFSDAEVLSLTYQIITTKQRDFEVLHKNAQNILDALESRKVIVLDECHHMTNFWAEIIQRLIKKGVYVIGLTATPPLDREKKAIDTYLNLLEEVDYETLLPPVIKEGYLAPFQDLIYIVEPTDTELEQIKSMCLEYNNVITELKNTEEITPIQFWVESRLANYKDKKGLPVPFDELYIQNTELCIALTRFTLKELGELPYSVIITQEMQDTLTFSDMLLVLEDYSVNYLAESEKGRKYFKKLKHALNKMGYILSKNGVKNLPTGIKTILSLSKSKIIILKKILSHEMLMMQDDLRCLVLTDYEMDESRDGTSAIDVMRIITDNPEIDPCDPILVTGKTVLVDDDLLPGFKSFALVFFEREKIDAILSFKKVKGYVEVSGTGSGWNTRTYVKLITEMLELGITKCLISTKSLLGEGWDSLKLNTLVDLTVVSSFVFVNQIRGRTIRLDPDNYHKTANNWDVIAITNQTEIGHFDYERVKKKYSQFYGISEDDIIEKGIGHLHPLLASANLDTLVKKKDDINDDMLKRSEDRLSVYKRWKIGSPYKNLTTKCSEFIPVELEGGIESFYTERIIDNSLNTEIIKLGKKGNKLMVAGLLAIMCSLFLWANLDMRELNSSIIILIYYFISVLLCQKKGTLLIRPFANIKIRKILKNQKSIINLLYSFAHVVLLSLIEIGECEKQLTLGDISIKKRKDGSYRVFLENSYKAGVFAKAVADIISPIQSQKYIIENKVIEKHKAMQCWKDMKKSFKLTIGTKKLMIKQESFTSIYHPVPEVFSTHRKNADIFKKLWNKIVSRGKLLGTRSGNGKEIVKQLYRKKLIGLNFKEKDIWI